jgi:hypothetical protein
MDSPVRKSDVDAPVLPFQNPSLHSVAHPFGLDHMQRLERISKLEVGIVNHDLFGKVIMGCHGRGKWCSFIAGLIRLRRTRWESLAWSGICWWIIDSEDFTSVRIENGDKIARVCVEVIIRTESGKDETLLQSSTRKSLVVSDTPSFVCQLHSTSRNVAK